MKARLLQILRGLLMGTADIIPGVSGGTMALILGIYERLVASIKEIDLSFVKAFFSGRFWKKLFKSLLSEEGLDMEHPTDKRVSNVLFLGFLFVGIILAVLTAIKVIPYFLEHHPEPTRGLFFGLILASVLVPWRLMEKKGPVQLAALVVTAVATFFVVGLPINQSANATGEVVFERAAGVEGALTISASSTLVETDRFEDGSGMKEIAFRPVGDVVMPADATSITVPVISTRGGADTAAAAGEIKTLATPVAGIASVTNPSPTQGGSDPALWYIFICGALAICAMILPGISGSFILLLLGQYGYVLSTVHGFVYAGDTAALVVVGVFILGILAGILSFSRLLNLMLTKAHATTMAILVGLMLGSLRKIWPFQQIMPDQTSNVLPDGLDTTVLMTAGTFVVGVAIIVVMEIFGRKRQAAETK